MKYGVHFTGAPFCAFIKLDGPVKSMFSPKDAKKAKKYLLILTSYLCELCAFARDFDFLRLLQKFHDLLINCLQKGQINGIIMLAAIHMIKFMGTPILRKSLNR